MKSQTSKSQVKVQDPTNSTNLEQHKQNTRNDKEGAMSRKIAVSLLALATMALPVTARSQTMPPPADMPNIVLTGGPGWNTMPSAYFEPNGSFKIGNAPVGAQFGTSAATAGVQVLVGDFDGDGLSDIALVGVPGVSVVPIAFGKPNPYPNNSTGDSYIVELLDLGNFASLAAQPGVKALVGDFNGDGHTDIALVGAAGWNTVPVAFWNGSGFTVTNYPVWAPFQALAAQPGVHVLVGDFNGDGKSDIALVGGAGWASVPVAFSNGNGTFSVTNDTVTNSSPGDFARMAVSPGVQVLVADFNGDGKSDIALVGGSGWASVPVAFSDGDGSFKVTNDTITNSSPGDFARMAATPGVRALVGNFEASYVPVPEFGYTPPRPNVEIALVGGTGWNTLPVAHSNGDGTFKVTNLPVGLFAAWAATPGVQVLVGDFNGDGISDIALVGGAGWNSVPIAFGLGGGNFNVVNAPAGDIASWAAQPGVKVVAANMPYRPPLIDLAIQQSVLVPPTTSGGSFAYTISVTNSGPQDAYDVVVYTESIDPLNVEAYSPGSYISSSQGSCAWSRSGTQCDLGKIPNGSKATIVITEAWKFINSGDVLVTTSTVSDPDAVNSNASKNSATISSVIQ